MAAWKVCSLHPSVLPRNVSPKSVGRVQLRDSMMVDGLWDPYKEISMGSCAESCSNGLSISRQAQDEHAIASYELAAVAEALGVTKGDPENLIIEAQKRVTVSHDEECLKVILL